MSAGVKNCKALNFKAVTEFTDCDLGANSDNNSDKTLTASVNSDNSDNSDITKRRSGNAGK